MNLLNLLASAGAGLVGVTLGVVAWQLIRRPTVEPTTLASRLAATVVALVAGYASWRHIADVGRSVGEHDSVAVLLPLTVDGLIVVGTMTLLADKRHQRQPHWSARLALVFGVAATIAANIASAQPTVTARLVAAVPAISFLLAVEVLARAGKPIAVPVADEQPVNDGHDDADPDADVPAEPEPDRRREPAKVPARRTRVKALTNAEKVAKAAKALPAGTPEQIAAKAGVSERTARRYLPAPTEERPAETRVNGSELVSTR